MVHGRQRQPRRRPGRPAGHAAAARHRLQHDRQRRPRGAPAPRPGGRGRRGPARAADPQARAAQGRVLRRQPRRRSWTACAAPPPRTAARPPTSSGASRYPVYGKTGTAERAPNPDQSWYAAYVPHPTRPIVVVTTDRAGRLRRGDCGTRGAPDPRRVVPSVRPRASTRGPARRDERQDDDPAGLRAAAPARAAGVAPAPGPAAAAGHARPRRRVADLAQRRDAERHPRPAALLRLPPGDLRRASGSC